jgi:hypothetical protein
LEPKKTGGVWDRKRPGESGIKKDQESLELEERRPGESGIAREKTRKVWNRKREDQDR